MFKKISERKIHFIFLAFLVGFFLGINFSFKAKAEESTHTYLDYFHQVYQIIRTEYVEKIDNRNLFYGAIKGMISALNDPFSRFLDEESFSELKEETTGKFVGVGVEISVREGEIVIISPIEGSPAMKAGLRAGDIISRVNTVEIKDKSISEIVKMIRGLPNTTVSLTVVREGFDEPLTFEIERAPIKIETVHHDILKQYNVGYLKVKTFSADTEKEIEKSLKDFSKHNISRIIVDLRWNPGGLLEKSISISEFFLDKGKLIVSTRGREGSANVKEYFSEKNPLYRGKLVVLVNKGSASASEIFSGAMKDNRRAVLVGEKTFGKGSVQKFFNLNENIGVTLTIARYYTPSGVSIHGTGITPDHVVPAESFSEADRKNVNLILKDKLVETFIKTHKGYTAENKKEFMQFLTGKKLAVSEQSANFLLKSETYRYSKQPVYDLEFDPQLKKAIEVINEPSS